MKLNSTVTGIPSFEREDDHFVNERAVISGCFTKDTLVSTSEGPLHLGFLYRSHKKPEIVTKDGGVLKSEGVAYGGLQETFGLLTDSSYIKGTANHPVLRITSDCMLEMTKLTELRKGDFVVYHKGIWGSVTPEYNGKSIDIIEAQELGKHISNMSLYNVNISHLHYSDKFYNESGYFSINIFNVLNKFNIFVYRVPEKILCAPNEFVAAYLRGYFDGGNRYHLNRISAATACRELASDIIYLLSMFGVRGEIAKTRLGFEVVISNSVDINIFIKEVGFLKEHDFTGACSIFSQTGVDYKKLCNEYNLKSAVLSQSIVGLPGDIFELIENLDVYKESFIRLGLGEKFKTLDLLSRKDCRATEVIEYAKYIGRDEVFGVINVAGNHTWCANGIVVADKMCHLNSDSTTKKQVK